MIIRSTTPDGTTKDFPLPGIIKSLTIGRSPEADVVILDERASRLHCGLRLWEDDFYVKDLQSKNGTYLNGEKVEMSKVKPGDKIRIGATILELVDAIPDGPDTVLSKVQDEMSQGKGYDTILREIVDDVEPPVEVTGPLTLIQEKSKDESAEQSKGEKKPEIKPDAADATQPGIKPKGPKQIKVKRPPQ